MPGRDKTGPIGAGPMSGRGLGLCSGGKEKNFSPGSGPNPGSGLGQGRGLGRRRGFGRGMGRRFAEQERSAPLEKD